MFEKEEINEKACEHCNEVMCSVCEHKTCDNTHLATLKCREWRDRRAGFYCGAEFGYNKAKEDADKMKSQFLELCNLKDMRIAELEKANEWHYVKDGDYPKDNKPVLCILGDDIDDLNK